MGYAWPMFVGHLVATLGHRLAARPRRGLVLAPRRPRRARRVRHPGRPSGPSSSAPAHHRRGPRAAPAPAPPAPLARTTASPSPSRATASRRPARAARAHPSASSKDHTVPRSHRVSAHPHPAPPAPPGRARRRPRARPRRRTRVRARRAEVQQPGRRRHAGRPPAQVVLTFEEAPVELGAQVVVTGPPAPSPPGRPASRATT